MFVSHHRKVAGRALSLALVIVLLTGSAIYASPDSPSAVAASSLDISSARSLNTLSAPAGQAPVHALNFAPGASAGWWAALQRTLRQADPPGEGLSTTPDWTAESDQESALFARSVSTAGDVNGDGFADVIVGAPDYDNGQTDEGRAFVFHGSASGLSATPNWTAEINVIDAGFGFSAASAGDVNNDGYDDVIVGAYYYKNIQTAEGAAFVYHGSAAGLSATPNWSVESNQTNAEMGWAVAGAGDVNNDGYSDVLVAAPFYDAGQTDEGRLYAYYGSATGLSTTANWTAESNAATTWFGYDLASAGDVNGDGYDDIVVGAPLYANGETQEGLLFVYHGSATGLNANGTRPSGTPANADWSAESNQPAVPPTVFAPFFGSAVASAGDVDNDGFDDVLVGAYWYDFGQQDEGIALLYEGSATGLNKGGLRPSGTPLNADWIGQGNLANAQYGSALAGLGDVNDDGYDDIIVGAPYYDNGQIDEGRAFAYHGTSSGSHTAADWMAEGNLAGAFFGAAVNSAGDVNGDGIADAIVGAHKYANGQADEGRAFVFHGAVDPIAPPVAPRIEISHNGQDVILSWTHDPLNAGGYDVWYSLDPYFQPGDIGAVMVHVPPPALGNQVTWTHAGAAGNALNNFAYIVQGVNSVGVKSGDSNVVGEYGFSLVPGTP